MNIHNIWGRVVTYPAGSTFGPRRLHQWELVWIIQGQVIYHFDERDYPSPPGTILLCQPGIDDAYTWDPRRTTQHAFFHFSMSEPPAELPDPTGWPICCVMPDQDIVRPLFRFVLARLQSCGGVIAAPDMQLQQAISLMLGALVTRQMGQAPIYPPRLPLCIQAAVEYATGALDQDSSVCIGLEDLASAASVSGSHLCRRFRRVLDMTPMQMVRQLRLDRAMYLLGHGNLDISQIAYHCGFESPDHFSRCFKRVYADNPKNWRQRLASGEVMPTSPLFLKLNPSLTQ